MTRIPQIEGRRHSPEALARGDSNPSPDKVKESFQSNHMTSSLDSSAGEKFQLLVDLMARLRAPGGCPWDREQTFDSIKPYLLEETYETLDAIDARDWPELAGELGDLMLQAVFFSQMAAEDGLFRIGDALDAINQKLVRRHPHVFGNETAHTGDDVRKIWSEVKARESKHKDGTPRGLLANVPRTLPALVEAQQISSRAANAGFDWSNAGQVLEKVREEIAELEAERQLGAGGKIEEELGDLLFTLVNLARFVKVDPEQALRKANAKFRGRFGYVEEKLAERGRALAESGIEEMESLWQQAKLRERGA
jgi:MazG family protein